MKVPCPCCIPGAHHLKTATGVIPQITAGDDSLNLKTKAHCELKSKAVDVLLVTVLDSCKAAGIESPLKLISQDKDAVMFAMSQVWKGCLADNSDRSLRWIAVD
jgi:hypothetical protein